MKDFRKEAEQHWEFVDCLLKTVEDDSGTVPWETLKFLYIEAMIHGYKHAQQESPVTAEKVKNDV